MITRLVNLSVIRLGLAMMILFGGLSVFNPVYVDAAPGSEMAHMAELPVNINSANADDLQMVSGIGPTLAERIIAFREENGPFETPEEISQVKGIGGSRLQKIKTQISV